MRQAVLPRHGYRRPLSGGLRRARVKARLRLDRFANMGANTRVFRGVWGLLARLAGLVLTLNRVVCAGLSRLHDAAFRALRPLLGVAPAVRQAWKRLLQRLLALHHRHQQRQLSRTAPLLLMLSATILLLSFSYFGLGLQVRLDGEIIGYVDSKGEIDALVAEVEQRAAEYLGTPYSLSPNITYALRYMDSADPVDAEAFKERLFSEIDNVSRQYVLTVDGTVIGANSSRTALEMMLRRIIHARTAGQENAKTEFVEDVRIEEQAVLDSQMRTIAQMEEQLTVNTQEIQIYTVVGGDTVSGIAVNHGLSIAEIRELNPGIDINSIHIGDELMLSGAVPFLSLKKTVMEEYDAEIPYETEVIYDDSMYVNRSYIQTAGIPGKAHVTADVVYVNDQEESRTILTYEVLNEPSSAVKVAGSKPLPAKAATGTFVKPTNGRYSSGFGYRPNLGDYHTGTDFAGASGTSIWAADGGVVIYAGWKGNYGYCVMIDHDSNGFVTLYAHCSKLLVKVGQRVAKYEEIARVGNTGRSFGAHCHFEIRVNGTPVNPLKYIWK